MVDWNEYHNPSSILSRSIFLIFSMESFLPYKLYRAERAQDASKAKSLGPFAMLIRECSVFDKAKSKYTDKLTS